MIQNVFNTSWPSDTISRQRSGSTLSQVMACCLTAPSHYLNQCWPIISEVQRSSDIHIRAVSQEIPQPWITKIGLKITCLKFHSNFPGTNESKIVVNTFPSMNENYCNECHVTWECYILHKVLFEHELQNVHYMYIQHFEIFSCRHVHMHISQKVYTN